MPFSRKMVMDKAEINSNLVTNVSILHLCPNKNEVIHYLCLRKEKIASLRFRGTAIALPSSFINKNDVPHALRKRI